MCLGLPLGREKKVSSGKFGVCVLAPTGKRRTRSLLAERGCDHVCTNPQAFESHSKPAVDLAC